MRTTVAAVLAVAACPARAALAQAASPGGGDGDWPLPALVAVVALSALLGALAWRRWRREDGRAREIFEATLERCAGPAMVCAADGQSVALTADWREQVGGDPGAPLGGIAAGFFDDANAGSEIARLSDAASRGQSAETTLSLAGPGDRRCRLFAQPIGAATGEVLWRIEGCDDGAAATPPEEEVALDGLARLLGEAAVGVGVVDADGRLRYANAALAGWLGLAPGAIEPSARPAIGAVLEDARAGEPARARLTTPDGATIPVEAARFPGFAGDPAETVVALRRPSAQPAQAPSGIPVEGFRVLFDPVPAGMALLDGEGRVLTANRAVAKHLGREPREVERLDLASVVDAADRARYARWLKTAIDRSGPPVPLEVRIEGRDGRLCLFAGRLPGADAPDDGPRLVVYLEQRGEEGGLDEQLFQSQKMELIGQLAGGIAHDFNNLLQAMIGFCDLLLQRHSPKDQSFADIMQIKQNANRAANLVRQLLAFSRQQTLQPKVLNLTDVLAELSNLLRRLIGANIELRMVHGRDLGLIKVDQSQLEQVVINLAVNARDAMAEGGTLTITTADVTSGDPRIAEFDDLPDRDYVMLAISDTGCGIAKEHLDKIYEPFFTTKGVGAGTGLGLATVYGIINQTGGHIFVDSTEGAGTTFTIFLPRHEAEEAEVAADAAEEEAAQRRDLTGVGTVLLVEDEDAVRLFGARALRNKGYNVIEARDGEHALEVLNGGDGPVDLLVSDVMMPGLDGPGLIRQVRQSHPDLKVIFISGYTEDTFRERIDDGTVVHFLAKPFSLQDLAGKVKEVMHAPGA